MFKKTNSEAHTAFCPVYNFVFLTFQSWLNKSTVRLCQFFQKFFFKKPQIFYFEHNLLFARS